MRALGHAVIVHLPMCASRVLLEVVSTKGTYGILVPMNSHTWIRRAFRGWGDKLQGIRLVQVSLYSHPSLQNTTLTYSTVLEIMAAFLIRT